MKKEKDFDIRYNHRESDRSHIEKSVCLIDFKKTYQIIFRILYLKQTYIEININLDSFFITTISSQNSVTACITSFPE